MADFGFVGASYEAPSIYQDAQECINFRAEVDPNKQAGQRGVIALYPTPGLTTQAILTQQEVRGMRTVSGGQQMVAVCGPYVYVLTANLVPAVVGILNSTSGRVGISDNGVNVYIVDGAYRYTWRISGLPIASFTASISGTTLTVSSIPQGQIAVGTQIAGIGVLGNTIVTAFGVAASPIFDTAIGASLCGYGDAIGLDIPLRLLDLSLRDRADVEFSQALQHAFRVSQVGKSVDEIALLLAHFLAPHDGERLPGALQIAAQAMGKTDVEFYKLLERHSLEPKLFKD